MAREKVFRFKQFNVRNDKSAMKVGTDGVLLGAWADVKDATTILDVGTGTGLIALMLAQRCSASIVAIEIDEDAAKEAQLNFEESPWNERLFVERNDFNIFSSTYKNKFDVIVSNPPYFIDSLKCPDDKRGRARHTDSLSYDDLISGAKCLLADNGHICLITPSDVERIITSLAQQHNLNIIHKTLVYPTPVSAVKRILWQLSNNYQTCVEDAICIETERHVYTDEYKKLTRDFYLKF